MELPYIAEASVLGVPHQEATELCGAVVSVRSGALAAGPEEVTLSRIRTDLTGRLAPFMLPAVLRILGEGEELPRTLSGKPIKKKILLDCFGVKDWFRAEEMPREVQYWGCDPPVVAEADVKPWDLGGLQEAD